MKLLYFAWSHSAKYISDKIGSKKLLVYAEITSPEPMVSPRYFWAPGTISHHALASLVMSKISAVVLRNNLPADVSRSVSRSTTWSWPGNLWNLWAWHRNATTCDLFQSKRHDFFTSPEFPLSLLRHSVGIPGPSGSMIHPCLANVVLLSDPLPVASASSAA